MINNTNSSVVAVGLGCFCVFAFCRLVLKLRLSTTMSTWIAQQQQQQQQEFFAGRTKAIVKEKTFSVLTHNVWWYVKSVLWFVFVV